MRPAEHLKETKLHTYLKKGSTAEASELIRNYSDEIPVKVTTTTQGQSRGFVLKNNDPFQRIYFNQGKNWNGDIFLQDKKLRSAVHIAAENGYDDIIKMLLDKGIDVNIKDGSGMSALFHAAGAGKIDTVKLLISRGAVYNLQDQIGMTPFHYLPQGHYTEDDLSYFIFGVGRSNVKEENDFQHAIHTLNLEYCSLLKSNAIKSKADLDSGFLKVALNILTTIKLFAPGSDDNEITKYINEIKASFLVLSSCVTSISYDLKKDYYHVLPWRNIETLRSLVFYGGNAEDAFSLPAANLLNNALKEIVVNSIPVIMYGINIVLHEETSWYKNGGGTADHPASNWIDKLSPLYHATEPFIDLRSMNELLLLSEHAIAIADSSVSAEKTHALLGMLKRIGEFSKYAQMSRNLSNPVKGQFNAIPWMDLSDLRNKIAKAMLTPSLRAQYLSIVHGNAGNLFKNLKADLVYFNKEIRAVRDNHLTMLTGGATQWQVQQLYTEENLDINTNLVLDDQNKTRLINDLKKSIDNAIAKFEGELKVLKQRKIDQVVRLENIGKPMGQDLIDKYDNGIDNLENKLKIKKMDVKFLEEKINAGKITKSTLEKIRINLSKEAKKEWEAVFDKNMSNNMPGVRKFIERLHETDLDTAFYNSVKSDRFALPQFLVKRLQEMLIPYNVILDAIRKNQKLIREDVTTPEAIYICNRLETYRSDLTLRIALEHVFSDLFETLEISGIHSNKGLRNQIEHQNNIFNTGGADIDTGNFHELLTIALDVELAINACKDEQKNEFNKAKLAVLKGDVSALKSLDLEPILNYQEEGTLKTLAHYCTDRKELTEKASICFDEKLIDNRAEVFQFLVETGADLSLKHVNNLDVKQVIEKNQKLPDLDKQLTEKLQLLVSSATKNTFINHGYSASGSSSTNRSTKAPASLTHNALS